MHRAIIDATLRLLHNVRYPALTIESVAAEAGVGKATVYRWWPSKGALVAEAMSSQLVVEDPPETGDLRADLIAAVAISMANYLRPPGEDLVHGLASDLSDDPALLAAFREDFIFPRRQVVTRLIDQAVERGELPPSCDPDLVMDMWAGALYYRGLFKHVPWTDDLPTQLVDAVLGPYFAEGTAPKKKAPSKTVGARSTRRTTKR